MDAIQYRNEVVANRWKHGFDAVDEYTNDFDPVWVTREVDDSIGEVTAFATLVEEPEIDAVDVSAVADEFRTVLVEQVEDRHGATTPVGYVTFVVANPDPSLVEAARSYTVARRRTNVFPLVFDCEAETLHRHEIPRLKGRGIYRRQAEDAARLFEV